MFPDFSLRLQRLGHSPQSLTAPWQVLSHLSGAHPAYPQLKPGMGLWAKGVGCLGDTGWRSVPERHLAFSDGGPGPLGSRGLDTTSAAEKVCSPQWESIEHLQFSSVSLVMSESL